jgi:histidine triad (HIT) family protein
MVGKGCSIYFELAHMSSVFTKIIGGDLPGHFVYRDEIAVAFLSINPIRPGHTLVVPIQEVSHWVDLDSDTNVHLMRVSHRIAKVQMELFEAQRIGMIIAGFEVPHTHLHLVPIEKESQLSFAHAARTVDHQELAQYAETMRSRLTS